MRLSAVDPCGIVPGVAITELLTVGEAFDDLIFLNLPHLPRPGEEVKTSRFSTTIGGGAIISAVAAQRLGIRCRILSGMSDATVRYLRSRGLSVRNLRKAGEPHAVSAALSTATNRSFVTFNGVNDLLEERLVPALAQERARHVHFAFFPRSCRRWEAIVRRLRTAGVTTSWDFGWNEALLDDRPFPMLLRALDYVLVNAQEAVLYSGRRTLAAAVAAWRRSPMHVVIKLGARGSHWVGRQTELRVRARRARVVDTTGAGDAFNGGFLAGRIRNLTPLMSLRLGNHVGTASTRRAGGLDGLPTFHELSPVFAPLGIRAATNRTPAQRRGERGVSEAS